MLIYGNYICYRVRHVNNTGLSESKYVQVALFSNLQVLALALPLLVIVANIPSSSMFVRSAVVFLNDACTMTLIFVPKILAVINKENLDIGKRSTKLRKSVLDTSLVAESRRGSSNRTASPR